MKFILGVKGFAREVDWLIHDIYSAGSADHRPDYFVCADGDASAGSTINGATVIQDRDFFSLVRDLDQHHCFIGVGSPPIRKALVGRMLTANPNVMFPNLIHPRACMDTRAGNIRMGVGNIICAGSVLTTEIALDDFVHINLNCTVGHNCSIASFCTLSPGVNMSGNVTLMNSAYIGTGASIIEGLRLCSDVVVGAGATVVRDLSVPGTYVGSPARLLQK